MGKDESFGTRRSPRILTRLGFPIGLAVIAVAALVSQIRLGVSTDPLWLMLLCDRLLDGQIAYLDFLENSPPFAILIYMPPVLAARAFRVAREPMLLAYVFGLSGVSLGFCGWLLARAGRFADVGKAGALAATASLLLLPSYTFGQRDHIVLILALPWLTLMGPRGSGERPVGWAALIAGTAAGMTFAIRPHYALSFALVLTYVGWRRGFLRLLRYAEVDAAVVSALASVAVSAVFFPYYVTRMLPIVNDLYIPFRFPLDVLIAQPPVLAWALLFAALVIWREPLKKSHFAMCAVAASIGALCAHLLQGKGYPYQCYIAVALQFVAFSIASKSVTAKPIVMAAAAAVFALLWFAFLEPGHAYLRRPVEILALAILLCLATLSGATMRIASGPIRLGGAAIAFAALGMGYASFEFGWRSPPFLEEVRQLGPKPKIAMIAAFGELAHPLLSRVDGEWSQSEVSLLLTDDVAWALKQRRPNEPDDRHLARYRTLEREIFLADVARTPPDAVIVNETWVAETDFEDASVKRWLDGYQPTASATVSSGNRAWLVKLYTQRKPDSPHASLTGRQFE